MTSISRGGDYRERNPVSIGEPEKVTSWPFKEPEKTSAWDKEPANDAAPRDAPIRLVDYEKETEDRKKAAIRERVSPAGALKFLPPRLEEMRLKYGIPDGVFKSIAGWDRVLVYPIDPFDYDSKHPGTGIERSALSQKKDQQDGYRGVLVSAGLTASDRLMSHGWELGDIVITNKNVPFARACERIPHIGDVYILVMREADLAANESLQKRIWDGEVRITDVGGPDGYSHQLETLVDGEWTTLKKKSVYVNDCW